MERGEEVIELSLAAAIASYINGKCWQVVTMVSCPIINRSKVNRLIVCQLVSAVVIRWMYLNHLGHHRDNLLWSYTLEILCLSSHIIDSKRSHFPGLV